MGSKRLLKRKELDALEIGIKPLLEAQDAKTLKEIVNYLAYKMIPTTREGEWAGTLLKKDWEYLQEEAGEK